MRVDFEHAYAVGDHRAARQLAREVLVRADDPELMVRARGVLHATAPDLFLTFVGVLGLGLTAWLVYNYVC